MRVLANISLSKRCQKTPTSDTESQIIKKRHLTIDNSDPEKPGNKEKITTSGRPKILRQGDGSRFSGILHRPNLHIGNSIQQLLEVREAESSVQILNIAIDEWKQKSPQ